jgi:hypothetical protein
MFNYDANGASTILKTLKTSGVNYAPSKLRALGAPSFNAVAFAQGDAASGVISYGPNNIDFIVLSENLSTSGVIVDPYISGAVLCEDLDRDGTCETGEQESSSSNASGHFSFNQPLTAGSHIIVKTQGTHEGKPYDLAIKGVVGADGSFDVVSPLTTLAAKGLTATQIAAILNKAAGDEGLVTFTHLIGTTVLDDPLSGGLLNKTLSQITNADLNRIQASLAAYGLLKIMDGSTTLASMPSDDLYDSGMNKDGVINLIARAVMKNTVNSLNTDLLLSVKGSIDTARASLVTGGVPSEQASQALPEPTVHMVIAIGTKVIDRLAGIGYGTCNATSGDDATKVTAALSSVQTVAASITQQKVMELGKTLYGLTYRNAINQLPTEAKSALLSADSSLATGVNAVNTVTTFQFTDDGGSVVPYPLP